MSDYLPRIVDEELQRGLRTSGAVYVRGPRACGKTATSQRACSSEIRLDESTPETFAALTDPRLALAGATPRLIDEWQAIPEIWNAVRHAIDDRKSRGQFILTGSATPELESRRHSGAGRIRALTMRTMSLMERFDDTQSEAASLSKLFDGTLQPNSGTDASVEDYAQWMTSGGWPGLQDLDVTDASDEVASYLAMMSEHDYPLIGGSRRDPRRFYAFLEAYAGVIAQPASFKAIGRRMGEITGTTPAEALVPQLHDFASRLFLIEDQPAWSTKLRSRTTLIQTPKRHLADVSLALSLLRASPKRLLSDLETLGIIFESLAVHDLRVYAQALRSRGVYHLRDVKGRLEIDAIVENADGDWIGCEMKLSHHGVDKAAKQLLHVAAHIESPPAALVVIIPTGPVVQRPDGVWVIPLASLCP